MKISEKPILSTAIAEILDDGENLNQRFDNAIVVIASCCDGLEREEGQR